MDVYWSRVVAWRFFCAQIVLPACWVHCESDRPWTWAIVSSMELWVLGVCILVETGPDIPDTHISPAGTSIIRYADYCSLIRARTLKIIHVWERVGGSGHADHLADEKLSLQSAHSPRDVLFLGIGGWEIDLRSSSSLFFWLQCWLDNWSRSRR